MTTPEQGLIHDGFAGLSAPQFMFLTRSVKNDSILIRQGKYIQIA